MQSSTDIENRSAALGDDLLEEHGDALYRYALLRLRSSHAAEDAVQETLVAALPQLNGDSPAFEGRSQQRTWLIAILRNKITDHLRRLARESPPAMESAESFSREFFDRKKWRDKPRDWGRALVEDPQTLLEREELRAILLNCLGLMPGRLARVFMLREAEELESAEICRVFNLSAANLWAILHRARMRLRRCLESHGIGGAMAKSKDQADK